MQLGEMSLWIIMQALFTQSPEHNPYLHFTLDIVMQWNILLKIEYETYPKILSYNCVLNSQYLKISQKVTKYDTQIESLSWKRSAQYCRQKEMILCVTL